MSYCITLRPKTILISILNFSYVAHLMENAPVGTALYFGDGQNPQVTDNDKVNAL